MTIIVSETNLYENTPLCSLKTKQDKAARQASINEDKDSVRSVIDDVDALLKSADPLPLSDSSSAKHDSSHDVMKELDELINS